MLQLPLNERVDLLSHLFTHWTVVINIQNVNVHADRSLELPVSGGDLERVPVFGLSVQPLLHDQTPHALVLLDDGELAQRVPACRVKNREVTDDSSARWTNAEQVGNESFIPKPDDI